MNDDLEGQPTADHDPLLGHTLADKYRLDAVLGRGGMGSVYRAFQLDLGRGVAIKLILPELASHRAVIDRFKREALAVARLRHPHIVSVFDFGIDSDAGAFIVLELLEGDSLRTRVRRDGPLPLPLALALAGQVASAIAAAHGAGVLHRDLKPDNVFLERTPDGPRAKVLDFGVAKLVDEPTELTLPGTPVGTPAYMAPEQCEGRAVDERTDVYALGCLLYEMLTGSPPFRAATLAAMAYKHAHEPPRAPSRERPEVPPHVDAVVLRALRKRPEERFASVAELGLALEGRGTGDVARMWEVSTVVEEQVTRGDLAPPTAPHDNLPESLTSFVGRERELAALAARLSVARLLTVVGPGGMGKTRVSLEVAARTRREFRDGVWLVELSRLLDPSLVVAAVADALGVREEPGRPLLDSVAEFARSRRLLVVLDNCEHVVEAAAAAARALVGAGPDVRVLATSREPLGVPGEVVHPLAPLLDWESVRLFVERARLSNPSFEVTPSNAAAVSRLCALLEAMPLAIELAAARARVLSVEGILAKMNDRLRLLVGGGRTVELRQQTLRAAIDWSYTLLTEDERTLYGRLSAFAGDWSLEAAEVVCAGGAIDELAVLDHLTRLVDKSLVAVEASAAGPRFRMLEVIRQYAREKLEASGEAARVRGAHLAWCIDLGEAHVQHRFDASAGERLARLEAELDNLRAALQWSVRDGGDVAGGLRLTIALFRFWMLRGLFGEGERWIVDALAVGAEAPAALRADALFGLSAMRLNLGDFAGSAEASDACLALEREVGDMAGVVAALTNRGICATYLGEYERGAELLAESVELSRQHGFDQELTRALRSVAELALVRDDLEEARASFEEFAERCRGSWRPFDAPCGFACFAETLRLLGDLEGAQGRLDECIAMAREMRYHAMEVNSKLFLGKILRDRGEFERARAVLAEAAEAFRESGSKDDLIEVLGALACQAAMRGDAERAFRLAAAVETAGPAAGIPLHPVMRHEIGARLAAVRGRLRDDEIALAEARGRALSLDEALVDALAGG